MISGYVLNTQVITRIYPVRLARKCHVGQELLLLNVLVSAEINGCVVKESVSRITALNAEVKKKKTVTFICI